MASLHALLLLSLLLPLSVSGSIGYYCGSYFKGTQIQTNINNLLTNLVAEGSVGGFATSSYGKGSNTIYGLAQCRGDVSHADCSACLGEAAKELPVDCPSQSDARVWYDYCFMRYDNTNFIGQADTGYGLILINTENATDPVAFDKEVGKLMTKVRAQAVVPGAGGLGRGKVQFTPYVTIYGLAQCTLDIEPIACSDCLAAAVAALPQYCQYRKGCQFHYSSCEARYEIYPFFFPLYSGGKGTAAAGQYYKVDMHP